MGTPFIEGWNFVQVLGEGAYGEVKLAVNEENNTAVAVKIIALSSDRKRKDEIRKELCIQKMCNHPNIIRLYGSRQDENTMYLLLEYASGGELFDRIEPDIGMEPSEAQRLFRQLIDAVEYLFERGITHRDLKPENLLFDELDNLKVTDFGLATVFRHQGIERKLDKCCGTYPYVSPEVLEGRLHSAQPADLWSCGIILVAMLAGELPWDQPQAQFLEYRNWLENKTDYPPFNKLDVLSLSLLKKILQPDTQKRFSISDIKEHRWFKKELPKSTRLAKARNSYTPSAKRLCSGYNSLSPTDHGDGHGEVMSYSQPDPSSTRERVDDQLHHTSDEQLYSFSQPIDPENMLLSQIPCTPGSSQTTMQRLVRRMTRYYVIGERDQVIDDLTRACAQLGYNQKKQNAYMFNITTTDRRNKNLVFKVSLLDIDGLLLDFRLSKLEHDNGAFNVRLKSYRGEYTQAHLDRISRGRGVLVLIIKDLNRHINYHAQMTPSNRELVAKDIRLLVNSTCLSSVVTCLDLTRLVCWLSQVTQWLE